MAITEKQAVMALRKSTGFITHAAKALGISRQQLHNIINKYPAVKEALIDAREEMKDFTEGKMREKIDGGDTTMIIFYAKTQMKDRGYVERHEIDHSGGFNIKVEYGDGRINSQPEATAPKAD